MVVAGGLLLVALTAFVASVGVGILLGRRLDRLMEARAAREAEGAKEVQPK